MQWEFKGEPVTELPDGKVGFIYVTRYTDGSFYIGKKACYSERKVPALKSTPEEDIVHRIILRDQEGKICVGSKQKSAARSLGCVAKKEPYRVIVAENSWPSYEGSSSLKDSYVLATKEIVAWCNTKQAMTYMEADLQFRSGALFDMQCLNMNILGKFFPNVLDGEETNG